MNKLESLLGACAGMNPSDISEATWKEIQQEFSRNHTALRSGFDALIGAELKRIAQALLPFCQDQAQADAIASDFFTCDEPNHSYKNGIDLVPKTLRALMVARQAALSPSKGRIPALLDAVALCQQFLS